MQESEGTDPSRDHCCAFCFPPGKEVESRKRDKYFSQDDKGSGFKSLNKRETTDSINITKPISLRRRKMTFSPNKFSRYLSPSLILIFLISSFLISNSTSSEVSSFQQQFGLNNNNANSNNNNMGSNSVSNNNASGRNINSGIFTSNNFGSGSSTSSGFPSSSSSGGPISVLPTPPSDAPSNSKPTAYFIAGLSSQIRKINSTAMMLLTRDKPFQLQFRTVCPFGNIVYDDKFAISINSGGNMTYSTKPNEFPSSISHHSVADGRWHSITFTGSLISLDDHEVDVHRTEDQANTPVVNWDTNQSSEIDQTAKLNHMLHFFDGFVGCIRVPSPLHDHASGGKKQQNVQSHEESYFTPESPSEHQIVSLHDLFQLRTPFAPCNDTDVELTSIHSCFNPDTFIMCSKCQNGASCKPDPTDNPMSNQCECPPNTEEVEYSGRYCEYPPPPGSAHEEFTRQTSSSEFESSSELGEGDLPISAPSNLDSSSSYANSSMMDLGSGRISMSAANLAEHVSTTTTTEAPQEIPFVIEGSCPCINGGLCLPSSLHQGQHFCNCTSTGYEGIHCETDEDECKKHQNICNNGICINQPGFFSCFCTPGWGGSRCLKNWDDCLSNPCKNGTCHDLIDNYSCECHPGYEGINCENEVNECESNPCRHGLCEDKLNDFFCTCEAGYEGKLCDQDIDECEAAPCEHNGQCIDKVNGFECDCADTGFEGPLCSVNVDDCRFDSCSNNGTCIDGIKEYKCECPLGFLGNSCEIDEDECTSHLPCLHGQCFQKSNQSLYAPDVDESIRELLPLHFSYDTAAGYVCLCEAGYTGENCSIDINECELQVNPCGRNGNCKDGVNAFKCECHTGFTGERCESEINECEELNPCVRGECFDKIGDYECRCPEGYGAKNCGVLLTGCVRDPCDKVGFAKCFAFYDEDTNNHTFECQCKEGYTGKTCHAKTIMSFNGSGPVEITTNDRHYDNGNYELLFKFRTTLPDVLLIVGSGITYFYLTLSGGKLNLQSSLLNSLEGISVGQNLSNAELHKVWISVNSTHIALAADSQQTFYPIQTEDVHTGFNVTYIGGGITNAFVNNPTKKVIKSQFIGCMQDIIINGENERVIPDNLNSSNIEVGCKRTDQCKPNPCKNSGNCTDLWQNFTCKCLRPYLGDRCQHEYTAATFQHESKNNSLAWVEISPDIGNKFISTFDISMFVRTRKRNGTIFLLGNEFNGNYSVFLEAEVGEIGNLVVQAKWSDGMDDPNSKLEVYAVDGLQITDGFPHLVSIQREKGLVKISVNGTEHFRKSVGNRITFNPSLLYIGGKPVLSDVVSNQLESSSSRAGRALVTEVTEETEDSTTNPESVISVGALDSREAVTEEVENNELTVTNPFKGVIQDVRVNFSSTEAVTMGLGHSHLQQHAKTQNHYVVEFYPLNINSTYAMGEPLGHVERQNLIEGVASDDACKINKCLNGGTCEITWNDFKCLCAEGFDGNLCEFKLPCAIMSCPEGSTCHNIGWKGFECVSESSFQGNGAVSPHYHLISNELENITFNEISFRFRTKSVGNVLYVANGSQSFQIGLEEDVDLQNQPVDAIAVYIDGTRHFGKIRNILDGRWHNISVKVVISEKDTLHLLVDGKEYKLSQPIEAGSMSLDYLNDLIKSPEVEIVVGSRVEHGDHYNQVGHQEDAHNQFYRGCLSDIKLGDYRLPFVSPAQLQEINLNTTLSTTTAPTAFYIEESSIQGKSLHLGCIVCYDNECQNNGYCTKPEDSFLCTCLKGFQGDQCQANIDECAEHDCQNGGQCIDGIANYTCSCAPGFTSWRCDQNIDECVQDPCRNGGVCVDGINAYSCICTEEFLGHNCEKRKRSSCKDDPCENGATCYDRPQHYSNDVTFECECQAGWEGETCSVKIDYCKQINCFNGGTCHNKPLGYECYCVAGYDGPLCDININDCEPQPCKNNGTCQDLVNGFECHCTKTGYTGNSCQFDLNECEMPRMCPPAQICENLPGTYTCTCPDETMCGEHCDILNPCNNKTCFNGGECKSTCFEENKTEWICECLGNYEGPFCDVLTMSQRDQPLDILLIIIPIIAAFLIAALISIVILVRMARKKRATRGVYSPSAQEIFNVRVELDNVLKPPPEERLI